jgi:hypothetical protein
MFWPQNTTRVNGPLLKYPERARSVISFVMQPRTCRKRSGFVLAEHRAQTVRALARRKLAVNSKQFAKWIPTSMDIRLQSLSIYVIDGRRRNMSHDPQTTPSTYKILITVMIIQFVCGFVFGWVLHGGI